MEIISDMANTVMGPRTALMEAMNSTAVRLYLWLLVHASRMLLQLNHTYYMCGQFHCE